MKADDAGRVVTVVRMLWPHSTLGGEPRDVVKLWASMLEDFDAAEVEGAVRELAIGREHAPPVGVVVAKCAERRLGLPAWDQVWPELEAASIAAHTVRGFRIPRADEFSHPAVGEFARAHWRSLCPLPARDLGTLRAQMRDAWHGMAGRSKRDVALDAVGAERPVPVLEDGFPGGHPSDRLVSGYLRTLPPSV